MSETSRREFFKAAGAAATGVLASTTASPAAIEPQTQRVSTNADRFRDLVQKREPFECISVFDVLSARMVQLMGFRSVVAGGVPMAEFQGLPDWGLTTIDERINFATHIAENVELPTVADIDDPGDPLSVYRVVKKLERSGIVSMHFGDGDGVMGRVTSITPANEMIDKIHAALDARSAGILISIRCQSLMLEGMEKTVARAAAYAEAGAEAIQFTPTPSFNDFPRISDTVKAALAAAFGAQESLSLAKQSRITVVRYMSLLDNIAQSAAYDALMEFKNTGMWAKSSRGQRLGSTIPADFRAKMLQTDEQTRRGNKHNVG